MNDASQSNYAKQINGLFRARNFSFFYIKSVLLFIIPVLKFYIIDTIERPLVYSAIFLGNRQQS